MRKVLVVDDERQIVKLIEINLRKAGYEVICAYDGRQALEKARADRPDLIVLDLGLPDMNAGQICEELRGDAATRHIPVVTLGGPGQGLGNAPSLPKPFNPRRLLETVDELVPGWAVGLSHTQARDRSRAAVKMASCLVVAPPGPLPDEIVGALRRAGCAVSRATSVETALARVRQKRPERVLILGYDVEQADGIRTSLSRVPILSHTPILVLMDADAIRRFIEALGR